MNAGRSCVITIKEYRRACDDSGDGLYDGTCVGCDTRPEIRLHIPGASVQQRSLKTRENTHAFFCDRASDGGTLHLTLGVDDDTSVILFQR